jgi:hypothetical protein
MICSTFGNRHSLQHTLQGKAQVPFEPSRNNTKVANMISELEYLLHEPFTIFFQKASATHCMNVQHIVSACWLILTMLFTAFQFCYSSVCDWARDGKVLYLPIPKWPLLQISQNLTCRCEGWGWVWRRQAMSVQCNIEVCLCNCCSSGKAISITYSECVFVTLVIQHAMRMCRTVLSSVACPALQYLSTLPHKCHDYFKKFLNIKCGFWFLYTFCLKHISF